MRCNKEHHHSITSSIASCVATRLSVPNGADGPESELANAMRIGSGRVQRMAAQATAMSRTAHMTPAAIAPERDFGPNWPLTTTLSLEALVLAVNIAKPPEPLRKA